MLSSPARTLPAVSFTVSVASRSDLVAVHPQPPPLSSQLLVERCRARKVAARTAQSRHCDGLQIRKEARSPVASSEPSRSESTGPVRVSPWLRSSSAQRSRITRGRARRAQHIRCLDAFALPDDAFFVQIGLRNRAFLRARLDWRHPARAAVSRDPGHHSKCHLGK
jgi:hypothetical protein